MSRGGQEILKTNIEYRTRNIELRSEKPSKFLVPCSILCGFIIKASDLQTHCYY
jgi:hypothetical protein